MRLSRHSLWPASSSSRPRRRRPQRSFSARRPARRDEPDPRPWSRSSSRTADGRSSPRAVADRTRGRKVRPADRFWVGSVTTSFVATVVMQLVVEQRLGLDRPWSGSCPAASARDGGFGVRNLLDHTSGIPDYMRLEPWGSAVARNPRVVIPARRLVSSAAGLPLEFEPGSQASYSNTNYLVLAEILERVTGRPLARLLRERIFEPLGLRVDDLRERASPGRGATRSTATTSPGPSRATSPSTGSAARGPTAQSCRAPAISPCSSARCCAASSSRAGSSPR